jgi:hypothetical protein
VFIKVGYDIVFEHPVPKPMVAMLYLHLSCAAAIRRNEYLLIDPQTQIGDYVDGFGNRCARFTDPCVGEDAYRGSAIRLGSRLWPHQPSRTRRR